MKRILCLLFLFIICFTGCLGDSDPNVSTTDPLSSQYKIGDEIELGGVKFNIYRINDIRNELYLLAQNNVATTVYSADGSASGYYKYDDSLVKWYVDEFVSELKDKGVEVKSSGIISMEDLYALGFVRNESLSGLPYHVGDGTPEFVKYVGNFWLGGSCKYDTMSWVYYDEKIDIKSLDNEYGVRPSVVIDASEINKICN